MIVHRDLHAIYGLCVDHWDKLQSANGHHDVESVEEKNI